MKAKRKPSTFYNQVFDNQLLCSLGPLFGDANADETVFSELDEPQESRDMLLESCEPIESFLEFKNCSDQSESNFGDTTTGSTNTEGILEKDEGNGYCSGIVDQYIVPLSLVERWGSAMDIVYPDSKRCCCFTKSYYRYVKGTGSLLATLQAKRKPSTFHNQVFDNQLLRSLGPLCGDADADETFFSELEEPQESRDRLLESCEPIESFLEFKNCSDQWESNFWDTTTGSTNTEGILEKDERNGYCSGIVHQYIVPLSLERGGEVPWPKNKDKASSLKEQHLRYFTPKEFPQRISLRQRCALRWNSFEYSSGCSVTQILICRIIVIILKTLQCSRCRSHPQLYVWLTISTTIRKEETLNLSQSSVSELDEPQESRDTILESCEPIESFLEFKNCSDQSESNFVDTTTGSTNTEGILEKDEGNRYCSGIVDQYIVPLSLVESLGVHQRKLSKSEKSEILRIVDVYAPWILYPGELCIAEELFEYSSGCVTQILICRIITSTLELM
ncbi:hypothetical protein DVH24_021063 [Malus domestica]|uniref:Uncharacterized protein n=1 Tax=Malus domestica TaxID=3750 RepID=A0A498J975_MALDO|nr:hypothetical protein DVH24_021063 [Malus domestica]